METVALCKTSVVGPPSYLRPYPLITHCVPKVCDIEIYALSYHQHSNTTTLILLGIIMLKLVTCSNL